MKTLSIMAMLMLASVVAFVSVLTTSQTVIADSGSEDAQQVESQSINKALIKQQFEQAVPKVRVLDVQPSIIQGLAEVELVGGQLVYISLDGQFMIPTGDLYKLETNRLVDYRAKQLAPKRAKKLSEVDRNQLITYEAEGEMLHEIFVFTDYSCGYCQKFHRQMPALNKAGITVHYLAFPRQPMGSKPFKTMEHIWCAEDRQKEMTKYKSSPKKTTDHWFNCENPVLAQQDLGGSIGVTGTPAVFDASGNQLGGYVPIERLLEKLNQQ